MGGGGALSKFTRLSLMRLDYALCESAASQKARLFAVELAFAGIFCMPEAGFLDLISRFPVVIAPLGDLGHEATVLFIIV